MDTVELLQKCHSGAIMGIASIEGVLEKIQPSNIDIILNNFKRQHDEIEKKISTMLNRENAEKKEPSAMAKTMALFKINMMLLFKKDEKSGAKLITQGCNMGVKSLNKYLVQYKDASQDAQQIAKDLIKVEEKLAQELKRYL
ncbi:MAG: hypothetical protein ACRCW1_07210 [Anaerotignaceae bacterium]